MPELESSTHANSSMLESVGDDGDDFPEFGVSEDLVSSPQHKAAGTGSLDFDGLLGPGKSLVLHEDLKEGNGGQAWPAGMVLAKYLLRRKREELRNASIIELGAGGGLVGYVSVVNDQSTRQDYQILKTEASKSRSKRPANTKNTVFTDYASRLAIALGCSPTQPIHITDQSYMVPLMNRNIVLNNLTSQQIRASTYDWGSSARPAELPAQANVILAADCVYFEPAFPLLLKTLEDLLESEQTTCYFCFKRRRRADMQFLKAAKKRFEVVDVPNDPDEAIWRRENIYLCTIRKKRKNTSS